MTTAFFVDCVAGLTKCQKEQRTALGPLGNAPPGRFAPECDANGQYNRIQCYSATGYCWCVDLLGREIPGTRSQGLVSCPDKGLYLMLFTISHGQNLVELLKILKIMYQFMFRRLEF